MARVLWTSSLQDLKVEWSPSSVSVVYQCEATKKPATNAREKTLSISKEKFLRNKRREEILENTGMCYWARNSTATRTKVIKSTKTCRVSQVFSLRVKWKRPRMTTLYSIHLCLYSQTREESIILKQERRETSG